MTDEQSPAVPAEVRALVERTARRLEALLDECTWLPVVNVNVSFETADGTVLAHADCVDLDEHTRWHLALLPGATARGREPLDTRSPDCRDANHHKCDLLAWNSAKDSLADCACTCHTPKEDC